MGCLKLKYYSESGSYLRTSLELVHGNKDLLSQKEVSSKTPQSTLKIVEKNSGQHYRYGFQGQEMDDEVKGEGNSVNYKYRMHDPRIGRFFAVDPLAPNYPHNSPYAFSENSTIAFVELEGLEKFYAADGELLGQIGDNTKIKVVTASYTDDEVRSIIANVNSGAAGAWTDANALYHAGSVNLQNTSDESIKAVATTIYKKNKLANWNNLKDGTVQITTGGANYATTDMEKGKILINLEKSSGSTGTIDFKMNNYYDLLSVLYHESLHSADLKSGLIQPKLGHWYSAGHHAKIRMAQFNQKGVWENVSELYADEARGKFRNDLWNAEFKLNEMKARERLTDDFYNTEMNILLDLKKQYETKFSVTLEDQGFETYKETPNE